MRRLVFQIHLYLGLFAGAGFALLGVTGSLLVFDHAIDAFLNPAAVTAQAPGEPVPLQAMVTAAVTAQPATYAPFRIIAPRDEGGVYTVWSAIPKAQGSGYLLTHVDPASGKVLSQRVWGESLMGFIYKLHYALQLGAMGETAVGVLGLLMLVSIATALYLWWPPLGRFLRALGVRLPARGYRLHFELHKGFGFYTAIGLFVIALSGIYIVFPVATTALVDSVLEVAEAPAGLHSTPRPGAETITPDRAVAIARRAFPQAELKRVGLPAGPRGVYRVGLRQPGEVQQSYGQTQLWVDRYSGEILAIDDYYEQPAGSRLLAWQFPLHNGEAFGLTGRWTVFALGFVPLVLYLTGFVMWWKGRTARRRQRAQRLSSERSEAAFTSVRNRH